MNNAFINVECCNLYIYSTWISSTFPRGLDVPDVLCRTFKLKKLITLMFFMIKFAGDWNNTKNNIQMKFSIKPDGAWEMHNNKIVYITFSNIAQQYNFIAYCLKLKIYINSKIVTGIGKYYWNNKFQRHIWCIKFHQTEITFFHLIWFIWYFI